MSIKGYSTQEKEDRLSAQFATIEPVRTQQFGLSAIAHMYVYEVGTDAVEAGSTTSIIVATAHAAKKGDVIRFTSGALSGKEVKVWEVAANAITLAETLTQAPAATDSFQILRHKYPMVDQNGLLSVLVGATVLAPDAAKESTLASLNGKITVCDTGSVTIASSALPSGAATETTLSALSGKITACNTGSVTVVSAPLPTDAAKDSTLSAMSAKLPASLGAKTAANSLSVTLPSDQQAIPMAQTGKSALGYARHDYSSTPVTSGVWQLVTVGVAQAVNEVEIFDSSGQTMILGVGDPAQAKLYIFPGGNGRIPLAIGAGGSRISIMAASATANSGEFLINFYS